MSKIWSDKVLVEACLRQNAEAQLFMFNKYSPKLLAVAYRYAGNYDTANDLLQEGFIRIFDKLHTFSNQGSLEGWMRRVVITTCLNHLRKQAKWEINKLENMPDELPTIAAEALEKMDTTELLETINMMSEKNKYVLNLRAIEGYEYKEIAEILQTTEGNVRVYFSRAKIELSNLLTKKKHERQGLG